MGKTRIFIVDAILSNSSNSYCIFSENRFKNHLKQLFTQVW